MIYSSIAQQTNIVSLNINPLKHNGNYTYHLLYYTEYLHSAHAV